MLMSSSHNVPRQEAELGAGHYSRCVARAGPTALREAAVHCQLGAGRYIYISTHIYISTVCAQVRDSVPRPHGGGAGAGEGPG